MSLTTIDGFAPRQARPTITASADAFEVLGARLSFERDDEIFMQEDDAEFVYRVVSGVVRTTRLTDDGRRQVGGFYYPGDMLALEDTERHCFSAEALTQCTVVAVRRRVLEAEAARSPDLAQLLWKAGSRSMQRMQSHLLQIGRKTALERVAAILAELAGRSGEADVDLPMSRQDIADYLNLTIETVSRMLGQLQASHVIRLTSLRRMHVEDPTALQRLAA